MNIYYNAEYTGLNEDSTLISAGFVADNGNKLYIEFADVPYYLINSYVDSEILPRTFLHAWRSNSDKDINDCIQDGLDQSETEGFTYKVVNRSTAGATVASWIASQLNDEDIYAHIVSYCGHYDFVLLLNLFRGDIPNYIDQRYYDIYNDLLRQYPDKADDPLAQFDSFSESYSKEHALCYASRIRDIYNKLTRK